MGMKDSMRQREARVKGICRNFVPVYRHPRRLCRRECKKRLTYSYSNKSNLKLSMNLPDWNQIPSVVIFPMNTKTLVIL